MHDSPIVTKILRVDAAKLDAGILANAADAIRSGKLVAFPTETVYGLGANALDGRAVERIFVAKSRPAANPLIVHVADAEAAQSLAAEWSDDAARLAAAFWPGPLSIVVPKRPIVPSNVTAGGATVAIRVPAHPVAIALLKAARVPIAAPSANRSNHVSPTRAEHVLDDLAGQVDLVIDGGPCSGGLESTVIDLSTATPCVLRQGLVTAEQLEEVLGRPIGRGAPAADVLRSPGMLERHYAPAVPLTVVEPSEVAQEIERAAGSSEKTKDAPMGWLSLGPPCVSTDRNVLVVEMPIDATAYAQRLYAALRELEHAAVTSIVVTRPPTTTEWSAIHDRLRRAASL